MKRFEEFAENEVVNESEQNLDDKNRFISILASLIGCNGVLDYRIVLDKALENSITSVMVKEIVYQAVNYSGMGRVYPFLIATNEVMIEKESNFLLRVKQQLQ